MISAVRGPAEIKAAAIAYKRASSELKADINREIRTVFTPEWKAEISSRKKFKVDQMFLKGARVQAGNPPALIAANASKFGRALVPKEQWKIFEFGSSQKRVATYTRKSKNGGHHDVKRNVQAQLPPRYRTGRILYPAVADFGPRLAAYWTQTVMRRLLDALETR